MTIIVQPQTISALTLFMTEYFSDMKMIGVPVGFQSFFGRAETGARTDYVNNALQWSIDIKRGEKTISKMLPRVTGASWDLGSDTSSLKGQRFKNKTRVFPIVQEQCHVAFDDLFNRVAGENPINSDMGILERLRERVQEEMLENIQKIMRRNELAASESIRLGTQTLDDSQAYDYDRSTVNTAAATLVWTNANATIIEEIDDFCDQVQQNGKVEPDFCVPGADVFPAMIKQLAIQNIADNRGYMFIRAGNIQMLPDLPANMLWMVTAGFKYQAYLRTFKGRELYIFTYNEKYQDSSKVWQPYMPVDQFLLGYSGARCDRAFGPRITFPNNPFHDQAVNALLGFDFTSAPMPANLQDSGAFDPRMFHIDGAVNGDNDAISMRIITGPIFSTTWTDAFALITSVV